MRANRRAAERRGKILCDVLMQGEVIHHRVTVTNVTSSGLQMRTKTDCPVGARVSFHLPTVEGISIADGIIRYACPVKDETGARFAYGVEFAPVCVDEDLQND